MIIQSNVSPITGFVRISQFCIPDEAHVGQNVALNCPVFSRFARSSKEGSSLSVVASHKEEQHRVNLRSKACMRHMQRLIDQDLPKEIVPKSVQ